MNCYQVKELIQLFMDDELDACSTLKVQQHLEACTACRRLLDALLMQDQLLKQAARADTPDSSQVRARILAAIHHQPAFIKTPKLRRLIWPRIAATAVTAIIILLLVLRGLWMPDQHQSVYAAAVSDHVMHCSVEAMSSAITNSEELDQLATRYGRIGRIPDLSAFSYGDPRGRICEFNGVEFLHLVYYHPTEQPLSLFLGPHSARLSAEQLTVLRQDRYLVSAASRSGVDLLVVSLLDEQQALAITNALLAQLPGGN
jgi:anti-sigma factor RsiW